MGAREDDKGILELVRDRNVPNNQNAINTDASFRFNIPRSRALNSAHDDDGEPGMGSSPDEEGDRFIALLSSDGSCGIVSIAVSSGVACTDSIVRAVKVRRRVCCLNLRISVLDGGKIWREPLWLSHRGCVGWCGLQTSTWGMSSAACCHEPVTGAHARGCLPGLHFAGHMPPYREGASPHTG